MAFKAPTLPEFLAILAIATPKLREMEGMDFHAFAGAARGTLIAEVEALGASWTILVPPAGSELDGSVHLYPLAEDWADGPEPAFSFTLERIN